MRERWWVSARPPVGQGPPRAASQRARGRPWTAGVRRTRGLTHGRPGVEATICRAPTRSPACTPACTSRARGAWAHRPRSATSPSPGANRGCTFAPGRDRGGGGAQRPASGASRCPHGRAPGGGPRESRLPRAAPPTDRTPPGGPAYRAWSRLSHRRDRCDAQATARRPGRRAAQPAHSAPRGGQKSAAGVWRGRDRRPPH